MSRTEELAAKAARLKDRQDAAGVGSTSVATGVRTAVRVRPVRLTVDVAPADHAALARWCLDAAAELGVARVHGQELIRALLQRALRDAELRDATTAAVAATRRNTT